MAILFIDQILGSLEVIGNLFFYGIIIGIPILLIGRWLVNKNKERIKRDKLLNNSDYKFSLAEQQKDFYGVKDD